MELPDLTEPVGSTRTVRRLLQQFLTAIYRDFQRIPLSAVSTANRPLYQRSVALLHSLAAREPHTVLQLLRSPTISTLVQCITRQLHPGGDGRALNRWLREACALLLLEAAGAGKLPGPCEILPDETGWLPTLRSPTLGILVEATAALQAWALRDRQLGVRDSSGWHWADLSDLSAVPSSCARVAHPYCEIAPGLWLALSDNNPLADLEAHPDKSGNALSLGDQPVQAWLDALRWSVALIDRHLPLLGEELRLVLRLVVPVGFHDQKHLSASYQEAVGLIYMTLHPQPMTMAEALIHEYQHNKINAAFCLDPLLSNAWSPLYASPVRPDPRPLHGVILAVHAFQPVARLYEQMAADGHELAKNPSWNERFRRIIQLDRQGADTVLRHAKPTPTGQPFFAEMRALDEHLGALERRRWPEARDLGGHLDELAGHD